MCNDEARLQNRYLSRGCACHVEEEKRKEQTMRPRWYRTAAEYVSAIGNRRRSEVSDGRSLRMRPLLRFQVLGKRTTSWLCGSLQSSDWLPEGRNVCRPGRSTQRVRFFRRTSNDKAFSAEVIWRQWVGSWVRWGEGIARVWAGVCGIFHTSAPCDISNSQTDEQHY